MIWGKTSTYTGNSTDINRERRLSEFQRAMMLRPAQREMVQARMIANPYERDSTTRLERINSQVNADPFTNGRTSQAYRDAVANQLYNQPQSYAASGQQDNAYSRAQRSAQSKQAEDPSNQFSIGEINGRRVVAPQAGHYNEYQSVMSRLGLGDSPSPEAFSYAMDQQRIDPNKRYESDARVLADEAKKKADQDKQKSVNDSKKAKEDAAYRTKMGADMSKAEGVLGKIKSYDGYQEMLNKYANLLKAKRPTDMPEDFAAQLEANGIQFTRPELAGAMPTIVPRNKFDAAKYAPGRQQMEADQINALTRTPGGSRAVSDYMNQKYAPQIQEWVKAAEARNALPSAQPMQQMQEPQGQVNPQAQQARMQQDAQGLQQALAALQQRGLSQQQAMQRIQQSIQNMPPDKQQRAMAVLQYYGDRILQTQQVR